ncbi:MAG: hypothetical protein Q9173_004455 [Seirophora scorigena]
MQDEPPATKPREVTRDFRKEEQRKILKWVYLTTYASTSTTATVPGRGRTLIKAISGLVRATSVIPQVGFSMDPVFFAPVEDALIDLITLQDGDDGGGIVPFLEAAAERGAFVMTSPFQKTLQKN